MTRCICLFALTLFALAIDLGAQTPEWLWFQKTSGNDVRYFRKTFTVEGRENLKGFKGGAIVIANHSSHFDTPVALSTLPPSIRHKILVAAAADKFYGSRKKRTWWYSLFHGTFPVSRGGGPYRHGARRRGARAA